MDFDLTPYSPLRNELLNYGIQCGINARHQITVSTQKGSIWPDRGNSFWITCAPGSWYIFPWFSDGYAIPDETRLGDLCRRCMELKGEAMHIIPNEIVAEFNLRELTEDEADQVFAAMETAP